MNESENLEQVVQSRASSRDIWEEKYLKPSRNLGGRSNHSSQDISLLDRSFLIAGYAILVLGIISVIYAGISKDNSYSKTKVENAINWKSNNQR